jgi:GR25 family glycosyltransferase involved in LPS biosynthesis
MNNKETLFDVFNEFFDHIYLITLKRSTDRHDLIKNTLEGLNYTIFWGVDGRELQIEELEKNSVYHPYLTKILKKRKGQPPVNMTKAHIGCALSHLSVYKDIIVNNFKNALIFEDDILMNENAVETTIKALNELPENWELLRLGHFGSNSDPTTLLKIQVSILRFVANIFIRNERLRVLDPQVMRCWFARPYSENLELSGYHFGNHAYALTQEGARIILNYQTPIVQRSDDAVSELCSYEWIKAFNLKERVFFQNRDLPSTIAGEP